jgi:hypothetical protein
MSGRLNLSTGYLHNTGTMVSTGSANIFGNGFGPATVINSGVIHPTGPGIYLLFGGTVNNQAGGYVGAGGYGFGVNAGSGATVTNSGTLVGSIGVTVGGSGTAAQTVINSGTIAGTGGTAIAFGAGNDLLQLTPSTSLKIQGTADGGGGTNTLEFAASGTGTLTGVGADFVNFTKGTIDSGAYWVFAGTNTIGSSTTLTNSGTLGVSGGTFRNAGRIAGGKFIVDPATAINSGYMGTTVTLAGTGDVLNNYSTGTIAVAGTAVLGTGDAATVINAGTITTTATSVTSVGVYLSQLTHTGSLDNSGLISGGYIGVKLDSGTVNNSGTIKNPGTHFSGAGAGDSGIRVSGNATITNASTGLISAYVNGIYGIDGSTLSVDNAGTIQAYAAATPYGSYAIFAVGGLTVSNSGVLKSRKYTVDGFSSTSNNNHISNTGTITGGVAAVLIRGQGTVANNGGVMAGYAGIEFGGFGTVTNTATISGTYNNSGIILNAGGYVSNASSGVIQGVAAGVTVGGAAGTVINAGTITGYTGLGFGNNANTVIDTGTIVGTSGTAIAFGTANDLLKFTPSASVKIQGTVDGGGGTNTLEFASGGTGTLTGVGADFVNFTKGTIDSGAYWVFAGTNTIGSSTTLTNSGTLGISGGTFTNAGRITGGKFIVDPATVINSGYMSTPITLIGTGDVLTTASTGTIKASGAAIDATGSAAVVDNLGTIRGTVDGVALHAGGTITNGASNATNAVISAKYQYAIYSPSQAASTINNFGTLISPQNRVVRLTAGALYNGSSGSTAALIEGYSQVIFAQQLGTTATDATVVNFGTIRGTGGYGDPIELLHMGTVRIANYGTLTGYRYGDGIVANAISVTNVGTITATGSSFVSGVAAGTGFYLAGASALTNGSSNSNVGLISGFRSGVGFYAPNPVTITNFGTIIGAVGVRSVNPFNKTAAAQTIINAGTIIGTNGRAIVFDAGNDLL